jgi:hypothetical protein
MVFISFRKSFSFSFQFSLELESTSRASQTTHIWSCLASPKKVLSHVSVFFSLITVSDRYFEGYGKRKNSVKILRKIEFFFWII